MNHYEQESKICRKVHKYEHTESPGNVKKENANFKFINPVCLSVNALFFVILQIMDSE
jgi:hypothetical protein